MGAVPAVSKTDREAILQAAVVRLRADGMQALSMRTLAADVGIAPNALYHYFPSRAHLEQALSGEAARHMLLTLERAGKAARAGNVRRTSRADAELRIRALAAGYVRFAQREPHLYAVMLQGPCDTGEPNEHYTALWEFVCEAAGVLHGEERASESAMSLWALLHGAVALQQAGALKGMKPAECVQFGLNAWMRSR